MAATKEQRLVLTEDVSEEVFREGAVRRGWILLEEYSETNEAPFELVYTTEANTDVRIHYVDDPFILARYAIVKGKNIKTVVSLLETTFDAYDDEEVLENAEKAAKPQEIVDWMLNATALAEQAGRERLASLIRKRVGHRSSDVRRACLMAISWLEWPVFRELVVHLTRDKNAAVRADAKRLADAYALRDEGKL